MSSIFDVIVVGGGGSGLAAAVSAAQHGGRVLLLEKHPHLGGTTAIAVGSFTAAGTRWQRARQVTDSVSHHVADAGKFAVAQIESRNNPELRAFFLAHAAETLDWLASLGLTFVGPHPEPPNRVPRMHNVVPSAKAYIAALHRELKRRGSTVIASAAVKDLLHEEGRVTGVRAAIGATNPIQQEFRASRAVILAAGDYASSPELIRRFKGPGYDAVEGINPHAGGDGQRLVESAGGQLLNMDVTYGPELRFVPPTRAGISPSLPIGRWTNRFLAVVASALPAWAMRAYVKRLIVTWQHPENALFDDGAILLNSRGQRFCNEGRWPDRELAVAQQTGKIAYILIDGRLIEKYSRWPHFISPAPDIAYAYVADYRRLRPDVTVQARTIPELLAATARSGRNFDPVCVSAAIDAFNAYVAGKAPDPFGRATDQHPLDRDPWVLLGPAKAYFTTTEGGAAIDQQFRVLDGRGQPIPGLYAVGQNGLGGMILWGHGLHIAWAMTSGRLAGRAVMKDD